MTTKLGFIKMNISEFVTWISNLDVARTILYIQEHHTWSPDYDSFDQDNHFELQNAMKQYHVSNNGWMDIAQHFTTFPDGSILTGRSLEQSPACIFGFNTNAICIENLGNFDKSHDVMNAVHKDTIVGLTAALCEKFNIPVNTDRIVYHHWFNLETGDRNNGLGNNKSCPGTGFFGGNKVANCKENFLPLVAEELKDHPHVPVIPVKRYVCVIANAVNVRQGPSVKSKLVPDVEPAVLGAVLRVFEMEDGWYKISNSKRRWISSKYTKEVFRVAVKATSLNVRSGPGAGYPKIAALRKDQEVFIAEEKNGWSKIALGNQWVSSVFLTKY